MKVRPRRPFQSFFSMFLSVIVLGILISGCTSAGENTPTTTEGQATAAPTQVSTPSGPLADEPTGTDSAQGGTPLPSEEVKPLTFHLAYNDAAIERDIAQMYTPGSPTFHKFLTNEEIVKRYALPDAQLQQVKKWLTDSGYTLVSSDDLRASIQVKGTVATIERSLAIKLKAYKLLNRTFFMQEGEPKLPGSIRPFVQSIVGLNNFAIPEFKPPFLDSTSAMATGGNCQGYGAKQSLTRDKLAAAYQIDKLHQQNLQGQGMTVGVAQFSEPFSPADIANYAACVGIEVPKIETIHVHDPVAPGPGQGEAAMDIELIAGLAPKAQILVYQANLDNASFAQALVDLFTRVAVDNRTQILSVSYGTAESAFSSSEMKAINHSLRTLAAKGVSVFIASGDCGAYTLRLRYPQVAEVAFPASAPYSISVGGTHLQVNDNKQRTSETVWGEDDGTPVCQNQWGTGGGVSQNVTFKRPSWQVGEGTTTEYDGTSKGVLTAALPPLPVTAPNGLRQVPDIAAAGYPNIAIYYDGAWYSSGGTSASAPIWAAGTALINQALEQKGKTGLGGVPEFYSLANSPGKFKPYTDITQGDNLFYPATKGWDYTTGWGSPNFQEISQIALSR